MGSFTLKATAKGGEDKGRGCMPLALVRPPIHVAAKSPMRSDASRNLATARCQCSR